METVYHLDIEQIQTWAVVVPFWRPDLGSPDKSARGRPPQGWRNVFVYPESLRLTCLWWQEPIDGSLMIRHPYTGQKFLVGAKHLSQTLR